MSQNIPPELTPLFYKFLSNEWMRDTGYIRSLIENTVTDAKGNPIPWYTYPAIWFLQERVHKNLSVFEFGLGNSTLWWAKKCKSVTSVDHDSAWIEKIKPRLPNNAKIIHRVLEYGGAYSKILQELFARPQNGNASAALPEGFDIIVVDGRDRLNCMRNSVPYLSEKGCLILDNANRPNYQPGIDFLENEGFRNIKFYGLTPCVTHENITQIFYREKNCLGI